MVQTMGLEMVEMMDFQMVQTMGLQMVEMMDFQMVEKKES